MIQPPGGPPCLSPDRICAHGKGRGDELERLRAAPIGLSAGRFLAGSASYGVLHPKEGPERGRMLRNSRAIVLQSCVGNAGGAGQ